MNIAGWNLREKAAANFSYLSPTEIQANTRKQKNGLITNSHINIPEGTPYRVYQILRAPNGFKLAVVFDLPERIPYSAELEFDSIDAARMAGWAV